MPREVNVRPVSPADGDFLRFVFASTRSAELDALGPAGPAADAFIRMQLEARTRHYAAAYPDARDTVIEVDGEPAGRLIVNRAENEIRIVEIALLPQFRRRGFSGELVRALLEEADASGLPVRCHVLDGSEARTFWDRLGFEAVGQDGAHLAMERLCAAASS